MNPHFCCNFGKIPFLVKRVIQVVEEQAKPSGSSGISVPNDFEVSANEIEQQGFYDERGITIRISKLSLKSDRGTGAQTNSNLIRRALRAQAAG